MNRVHNLELAAARARNARAKLRLAGRSGDLDRQDYELADAGLTVAMDRIGRLMVREKTQQVRAKR